LVLVRASGTLVDAFEGIERLKRCAHVGMTRKNDTYRGQTSAAGGRPARRQSTANGTSPLHC